MATTIIHTPLFNKTVVLTSEARSIAATTDEDRIPVSLTCSGETFFTVDLYAYYGKVDLYDPGSLIEDFFIAHQMIYGQIVIKFGNDTKTMMFLYCEHDMPFLFNPRKVLLLSSYARRVHKDSQFTVAAIPVGSDTPLVIKAVGHDNLGKIASVQFNEDCDLIDPQYTTLSVSQIIQKANTLEDVIYFSVEHDERQLMCYIMPAKGYLTFRFRNIFNVPELVDIEGSMVTKSETTRKDAVCSGDIVQYDRRTDRIYQFTTGPLSNDEVESLEQLVSSHSVQLYADGIFYDVIIDEHTCEDSTDDEALSVIKFTWRFKGRRPVKFNSSLFGIQPSRREIFSDEYSPEYE